MRKILVLETGAEIWQLLQWQSPPEQMWIDAVRTVDALFGKLHQTTYDLVIWDTQTDQTNAGQGLELLTILAVDAPHTQVLVVVNRANLKLAIDSLQAGAFNYLRHPVDSDELYGLVTVALHKQSMRGGVSLLATEGLPDYFDDMIGRSAPMQVVYKRIQEAAATDITVLITGETGTGKDLAAASIHKRSYRHNGPYVAVNTGAISSDLIASELFGYEKGAFTGASTTKPGQFEQAHGGTIFLDEINTMDTKVQISLLRLLETQTLQRLGGRKPIQVDVRLLAATNEDLEQAIAQGKFRRDLYYRFDVFRIALPPLRERPEDIMLLARTFVTRFNTLYYKSVEEITAETVRLLERYAWPGNIREL